jgi:hypothetical protein
MPVRITENSPDQYVTNQGDMWLRQATVQAAKAASKSRTEFREFYSRVAGRRGTQVATTALARLLLTKVWNIIRTGKEYIVGRPLKVTYRLRKVREKKYYDDATDVMGILSSASLVASNLSNG